jgi:hypothetical protein
MMSMLTVPTKWWFVFPLFLPRILKANPESTTVLQEAADFGPLLKAAYVCGVCSIAVALIWASGLVVMARIKAGKGGKAKCG